ncbi:hypothetical protein AB0N17_41560 [Streptomyces sp. NPDC051133]|uniref:hypothetical protein n=1 Tax=Streptomyces sp. NPDC051133 TaxID=3155521 RepID=UPI00343B0F6E
MRGATITEKTASRTPQAKNTAPERYGVMFSTNGVKAGTVKSRDTWPAVACRHCAMDGRIGSTRPMPMKATTEALFRPDG